MIAYNYILEWKPFYLNLTKVNTAIRSIAGISYCGLSGNSRLELHFNEELSPAVWQFIKDYWDSITEESEEATSYISQSVILAQIQSLKEDAVTKSWDQLSVAQRKLITGLTPTNEELFV